ncbi:MAG: hypothetical protein RJB38_63 [Pseudomonadota bacterium]|jgi:hypothetical protein
MDLNLFYDDPMKTLWLTLLALIVLPHATLANPPYPGSPSCEPRAPIACVEACQRFQVDGSCLYRTGCNWNGECMTSSVCGSFNFQGRCLYDHTETTCRAPTTAPQPSYPITCSTSCQRRTAQGECLYLTKCEARDHCLRFTSCERFDFSGTCLSERVETTCY